MFSKEDQLLQKLQKCVGKLDSKASFSERNHEKEYFPNRISYSYSNQNKGPIQPPLRSYQKENLNETGFACLQQTKKSKWMDNDQQNYYQPQFKQDPKTRRQNVGKDYLSERSFQYPRQVNPKQRGNGRNNEDEEIKKKYEYEDIYKSKNVEDYKARNNLSTNNIEKPRRPLREYEVNIESKEYSQLYKEKKDTRSYLTQQSGTGNKQLSNVATKNYEKSYDLNEGSDARRNSVSYLEGINRSARKQNYSSNKRLQLTSNRFENYTSKQVGSASKPFNEAGNQYSQGDSLQSTINTRSRELSCQKNRQSGIGSISSMIKKNSLQDRNQSFDGYEGMQKETKVKKMLEQVGSGHQDTLAKLQKISELNQRINQRIKNIIQNFETK